ncbi:hypothetical protein QFC21_003963 [Naganishia friedmannii]|uniref:Uncharacterized protein n=1 Tax=Naganishia friedmannii TaxID=89922 RepID=A0ACC2VKL5_9TREE|nr:hypothetical protein QFC21_003963 [Naganishia friedmannii]
MFQSLIDLAGSEKAASNQERLAEGKHINRSLLALGTVIELLSDKNRRPGSHIPYRNSKLTHLLENALGGNANVAVICTLSAEIHHSSETLESLKFASRCAQVETQATQGIVASSEKALLQAKEEEISRLRDQISTLTSTRQQEAIQEESDAPEAQLKLHNELELLEDRRNRLVEQLRILNSEILSSHSTSTPSTTSSIGLAMRRRVSDFIRAHPGKAAQAADPATPSRRAVSGKITPINEDDSSDTHISSDLLQAFKRQRTADKEHHSVLLARLTAAESVTTEFETMKQEVERLKQCLLAESARSQELMEQLLGRDKLEAQQNRSIRDLESELAASNAEGEKLKAKRSISQPATLPSLDRSGLPSEPLHNNHRTNCSPQKLSEPVTISDRQTLQCSMCELYVERSRMQETIIQGQQSTNRALMEKVGEWQQRVHDQDALIQRLLPKMQQVIEKENTFKEPVKESFAPATPDKTFKVAERRHRAMYLSFVRLYTKMDIV